MNEKVDKYSNAIKWDLVHKIITTVQNAAGMAVSKNKNPYRK